MRKGRPGPSRTAVKGWRRGRFSGSRVARSTDSFALFAPLHGPGTGQYVLQYIDLLDRSWISFHPDSPTQLTTHHHSAKRRATATILPFAISYLLTAAPLYTPSSQRVRLNHNDTHNRSSPKRPFKTTSSPFTMSAPQHQVAAATAAAVPAPDIPTAKQCRGYILAHQHPSFRSVPSLSDSSDPHNPASTTPTDPYEAIPCPFPACPPPTLSTSCAARSPSGQPSSPVPQVQAGGEQQNVRQRMFKGGCAKGRWCGRHWCGGCKRSNGLRRQAGAGDGLSHGVVDNEQREGGDEYGHAKLQVLQVGEGGEASKADTPLPAAAAADTEGDEGLGMQGGLDGKTADLTLDCEAHMRGEHQASEPAHEIRL